MSNSVASAINPSVPEPVITRKCEECEEVIPIQRVRTIPSVRLCVECQEDAEREGRFQRHRGSFDIRFKNDEIESMEMNVVRGAV